MESVCASCSKESLWLVTEYDQNRPGVIPLTGLLLIPDHANAAAPEFDMPDDVKRDYLEAASIASKSPRGAAALLRLGLQKLCKHLGEPGQNINTDIRSLSGKNILPPKVIQVADTIRIIGNCAVHPGEITDDDFDAISLKLFDLLNFIVRKAITEPRELDELYEVAPEKARIAAESTDAKNKISSS